MENILRHPAINKQLVLCKKQELYAVNTIILVQNLIKFYFKSILVQSIEFIFNQLINKILCYNNKYKINIIVNQQQIRICNQNHHYKHIQFFCTLNKSKIKKTIQQIRPQNVKYNFHMMNENKSKINQSIWLIIQNLKIAGNLQNKWEEKMGKKINKSSQDETNKINKLDIIKKHDQRGNIRFNNLFLRFFSIILDRTTKKKKKQIDNSSQNTEKKPNINVLKQEMPYQNQLKNQYFECQNTQFPLKNLEIKNQNIQSPIKNPIPVDIAKSKQQNQEQFPLQFYSGKQKYLLDTFNSLTIRDGQIFNLLDEPINKEKLKKQIKCKCMHSKCLAKYCQCFSKGKKCGEDCGCNNCHNLQSPEREINQDSFKGCKCEKSHCLLNYCQCHKQGLLCNKKCKCIGCKNLLNSNEMNLQYSNLGQDVKLL